MFFDPLWLVILLFFCGAGIFLLPLMLFFVLVIGALLVVGFSLGSGGLPARAWGVLTDKSVRANFALCHAVQSELLAQGAILNGRGERNGFFIEGTDAENLIFETAIRCLARLKNGEQKLVIFPPCRTFRAMTAFLLALVLFVPCAAFGGAGVILAIIVGWCAAPWFSPIFQGLILRGSPLNSLSVASATYRQKTISSFGGRFQSLEAGVEVGTLATDAIEAEIVEE